MRLQLYCGERSEIDFSVYNLGVAGDRVEDLLKRLEAEYEVRNRWQVGVIIIAVGTNDTDSSYTPGGTPPDIFERDFERLLLLAQKLVPRVIVVTPTNILEGHPKAEFRYSSRLVEKTAEIER